MIKSYIKLAWRVLIKKKFFSFITLFGISITLMVLMTFIAFWETQTGDRSPISDKDKMVFVHRMQIREVAQDTITVYDTTMVSGQMQIDSTFEINDNIRSTSNASLSYFMADSQLRDLDNVEEYSIFSTGHTFDLFVNEIKLPFEAIYADENYFNVFDFIFIDGQAWTPQDVEQQAPVAIITEQGALEYFGTSEGLVGKEIEIEKKHYRIIGIVNTPSATMSYAHAHAYIPYTHMAPHYFAKDSYLGGFEMCYIANSTSLIPNIKEQIIAQSTDLPDISGEGYNRSGTKGLTFDERFAQNFIRDEDPASSQQQLFLIITTLLGLFTLLPILNLVNLNVSRMMDRSAEIGVRKAFGAGKVDLIIQFVFENVILTLIGGVVGFLLTILLISMLNTSGALSGIKLELNFKMMLLSLLVTILFGILSGVLPALKMAKIHIIQALKRS